MRAILERYGPRLGGPRRGRRGRAGRRHRGPRAGRCGAARLAFQPAPDDELLGARVLAAPLPSGRTLLLLEPTREGRVTAFLARQGEGLAALYVAGPARRRRGPLVHVEAADGPVVVLVTSRVVPAGTIRP